MNLCQKLYQKVLSRFPFFRKIEKFKIRLNGYCPPRKTMKNYATSATSYTTTRCLSVLNLCVLKNYSFAFLETKISCYVVSFKCA